MHFYVVVLDSGKRYTCAAGSKRDAFLAARSTYLESYGLPSSTTVLSTHIRQVTPTVGASL